VSGVVGGSGVVVDTIDFSCGEDVVVLEIGLGFGRDFDEVLDSFSWLDSTLESLKYFLNYINTMKYNYISIILNYIILYVLYNHTQKELLFRLRLVDMVYYDSFL